MAPKGRFNRFDAFTKTVEDGQSFRFTHLSISTSNMNQPAYEPPPAAS